MLYRIYKALVDFCSSLDGIPSPFITFVKAGECPPQSTTTHSSSKGILHKAADWVIMLDQEGSLTFPPHIATTTQRPDLVLYSDSTKTVVMVELTVPIEDNIAGAYASSKRPRYTQLVQDCIAANWHTHLFTVEIGSRGYCADTLKACLSALGFDRARTTQVVRDTSTTASRCSYLIYCRRNTGDWITPF